MKRMDPFVKIRRILWLISICSVVFAVLLGRLFVLTVFPSFPDATAHGLSEWTPLRSRADMEHFHLQLVDNARGDILYRSGLPMLTRTNPHAHVNAPNPMMGLIGKPDLWPTAHKDVAIYGRMGLENRFDSMLQGARGGYTGALDNSENHRKFYFPAHEGSDIRTTIDSIWQNASDKAMDSARVEDGAIVLLNLHTNDIMAMTSKSPNRFSNEAVRSFAPGSVFKLVTAAAALETHDIHRASPFVCTGRIDLPQVHMACWKVHGEESFTDAVVESCDIAFAKIAMRLGRNPIEVMGHNLGLESTGLQRVDGKSVLPEAFPGQIFLRRGQDDGLLANTAIGQQDVRISPLQGAILASAVAHGGLVKQADLVVDAERHGTLVRSFVGNEGWHSAFSSSTAAFLASTMEKVVTDKRGTAHDLYPCDVAVKTGTAELADKRFVNAWVIGYMPVNHPQIAFAVLSAKVPSAIGHKQTHQIVRDLAHMYKQIYPSSLIR